MRTTRFTPAILGAGPVARAIADELLARQMTPPIVVSRSGTTIVGCSSVALDIHNTAAGAEALAGVTHAFHTAQPAYHRWPEEFPALQAAVIDLCERLGARLVAVENLYGYGHTDEPMTESTPLRPTSRKGSTRASMTRSLFEAHRTGRIEAFTVRASDFFGPGVEASIYGTRLFDAIREGGAVDLMGDPSALHTVTFVPDLARTMVELSLDDRAYGQAWHAPSAPAVSQRALVERAATLAGTEVRIRVLPRWALQALGLFMKPLGESVEMLYEFEHDFVMNDRAVRDTFGLTNTPLDVALAKTMGIDPSPAVDDPSVDDPSVDVRALDTNAAYHAGRQ